MHDEHPLKDQTVVLGDNAGTGAREIDPKPGDKFEVIGWWDTLGMDPWYKIMNENWACHWYSQRAAKNGLPVDDEVIYGHDQHGYGHLIHASEMPS